jgi:hypothetical protein
MVTSSTTQKLTGNNRQNTEQNIYSYVWKTLKQNLPDNE